MTHPIAGAHPPPGRPREEWLLDGLTPEQAQAVRHGPGPLLLIAGPGAGKTKTLIHRIARLLATGAAQPWEILAVTFSVRAAGELRLRLADLLGEHVARVLGEHVARGVTATTFTRSARGCSESTPACSAAPRATPSTTTPTCGA